MTPKRARNERAKLDRRNALFEAALGLLLDKPYGAITLADVARDAQLSKASVYSYFPSKDELFFALYESVQGRWFEDADQALHDSAEKLSSQALVQLLAQTSTRHRVALPRLAALSGALEQSLSEQTLRKHKQRLWVRLVNTGARLEANFPALSKGGGIRLLQQFHALTVGIYELCNPPAAVLQICAELGLSELTRSFEQELAIATYLLLRGIEAEAGAK